MLESRNYEIRQKLVSIGKKYTIYEEGEEILHCKKKKLKLKEDFRFQDLDGNPVLKVTTDQIMDIAATYSVVDERGNEAVGAVKQDFTLLRHRWQLLDENGENIGTVSEDNMILALARRFVTTLIPFGYKVEKDGDKLAEISGKFSLRDRYSLNIIDEELDPRLMVTATVLIDAMEDN